MNNKYNSINFNFEGSLCIFVKSCLIVHMCGKDSCTNGIVMCNSVVGLVNKGSSFLSSLVQEILFDHIIQTLL